MDYLQSIGQQIMGMGFTDYLDIIIVALLIYKLLPMLRSSGAVRIVGAIGVILIIAWLTQVFNLLSLNFIISQFLQVGLVAIVVLFQPELRRMLDHLGSVKLKRLLGTQRPEQDMELVISHTVRACETMSHERVGALIVFARDSHLDEYFKTGTMIDGKVSAPLIRNIFFPKAALHDGAMIVRDGRVVAAGCVLPLSESNRLSVDLGTRHRAAVGMSEVTDAVIVVVSEETGAISVAIGGMLKRHLAGPTLEKLLRNELCPKDVAADSTVVMKLRQKFVKKEKEEKTETANAEKPDAPAQTKKGGSDHEE